ncbi:hypothetical protein D3C87_1202240 [compost metagenome]
MRRRQQTFGVDGQRYRCVEQFSQFGKLCCGIDRTATGENQRTLGAGQQRAHTAYGSGRGTGAVDVDRNTGEQLIGLFHQHVQRNFDVHRTRTPGLEQGECASEHAGQFRRRHQGVRERCDASDQCALVRQLVQLAAPAAQLVAALYAGDHQHRDRVGVSLAHGGGDVGHARAGNDEAHTRFAAGPRITVGHETGALFMSWGDVVDARTGQPAIQLHGVHARNAEHLLDPITFE